MQSNTKSVMTTSAAAGGYSVTADSSPVMESAKVQSPDLFDRVWFSYFDVSLTGTDISQLTGFFVLALAGLVHLRTLYLSFKDKPRET